ncbi:MAG: sigma-70 family RNA polymerase sigma factor [Candidatus Hydrogenedentes bacterium]|nr:sigma-70 family RNA polymerase sigma factor [Candidatus Hydrogenedentota bacterium]
MSQNDDWELVARAQAGDTTAFTELVRRYQVPLVHFCQRMVGSLQDAEDLAQDAFVRLHRHLNRLRPDARFSTVLFGIARNLTLNHLRDSRRRGRHQALPLDEQVRAPGGDNPGHRARLEEIETLLKAGLDSLSAEHREVLVLRELQGLDYESIAQVVRCRKGTVKSRIARAREQLRLRLLELGGQEL